MSKATVDSSALSKELKLIAPLIQKRVVVPIIAGVKMEFEKNRLTITGTNFNDTIVSQLPCNSKEELSFVINFSDLNGVCSMFSEPLFFELKENQVLISSSTSSFTFPLLGNVGDFPNEPSDNWDIKFDANGSFFDSLYKASQCVTKDELKVGMVCPCIDFQKSKTSIVGTDSNVLYKADFEISTGVFKKPMITNSFCLLVKHVQDATVYIGEKFIKAEYKSTIFYGRLHDAKFVSYEFITNLIREYNLDIGVEEFKRALSIVKMTAYEATGQVEASFGKEGVTMKSSNIDFGKEGVTSIPLQHSVTIPSISFNGNTMQNLLGFLNTETVKMSVEASNKSIFIKPHDDDSITCLIQPLMSIL